MAKPVVGDLMANDGVKFDRAELGNEAFGQHDLRRVAGYPDRHELSARDQCFLGGAHSQRQERSRAASCLERKRNRSREQRDSEQRAQARI